MMLEYDVSALLTMQQSRHAGSDVQKDVPRPRCEIDATAAAGLCVWAGVLQAFVR